MNRVIKFRAPIPKDSIAYVAMKDFCRDGCFYQDDQYLESFIRRANQFTYGGSGHSSYGAADLFRYTGKNDSNGKEIYEGDIVRCIRYGLNENIQQDKSKIWDDVNAAVVWSDEYCGWFVREADAKVDKSITYFDELYVISNIYDLTK